MGGGYVCNRCHMFADPYSKKRVQQICDEVNEREANGEDFYLGDLCRPK